ncbi:MAG: peptidase M42 [Spirochaetae bacterium HGW-Spirochaetae-3]|jgi:putative aminopeptidase FrvX|nr:MAG: peptidase M42 [Spirochaetae bacterium HGW-Spirochaetae-3]
MEDAIIDYAVQRIVELCAIPSPTGYTREAEAYVFAELESLGYGPEFTNKRSVRVKLGGQGRPLVLAAHIDTLGAMVRSVKPGGTLRITKLGGYPENYIEAENCVVHTRGGRRFTGRFLLDKPSVHVNNDVGSTKRDDTNLEIVLDEPVSKADETKALGIGPGDFVSFDPRTVVTGSGYIKSRHLDDKASAGALLALARFVRDESPRFDREIWLLFTNYEEVGHGGSAGLPPDTAEMLSVDMGAMGDDLSTDDRSVSICAKDSGGPYDLEMTDRLVTLAKGLGLRHAVDIYPFYGSDAGAALRAGYDIRHALIGPGVQASHGYERTSREAISGTIALTAAYCFGLPS